MTRFTGQSMFSEKKKLILMLEICREIDTTTIFLIFFFFLQLHLGRRGRLKPRRTLHMQKEKLSGFSAEK